MKNKSSLRIDKGLLYLPYKFMILLLCLFSMSCNRERGVEPLSGETDSDVIQLGASVNLQTRATNTGFELNDSIGLYLAKWQDASTPTLLAGTGNYADNALFRLSALSDSWTTAQTLYYPTDGSKLDFYAYYPYRAPAFGTGTTLNLSVASNQSAYSDYTRSDFMVAKTHGVKRSTSKVHLDFYHRLAQIVFVLKPGVGFTANDLKNAQVKIVNAIVDGTFDLSEKKDTVIAGTTRQDITPCGSWVESNGNQTGVMAILMPQHINTTTYIEVTVGSRKFSFKPSMATYMNPGCSREFTITVNNTGIDIETQIHPWNTCWPVSGDATEEEDDVIVRMTTTKINPTFTVKKTGDIEVDWGDGTKEMNVFNHTYTDGKDSHEIVFQGSDKVLKGLKAYNIELTSLEVSKNTALTYLNCSSNQLTNLEVSKNTALTSLICDRNQLTSLEVSKNIALTKLSCFSNQLTILEVSKNMALTTLWCDSNQLKSLEVSKNIALTSLFCNSNQLTSLEVSKNTALIEMSCTNNQLTSLDVSQNTALIFLACANNQLTSLEVSKNIALISLNCDNNQLKSLEVSQNTELIGLWCQSNQLTILEISKNMALTTLFCNSNQLTSLEVSKNTALKELSCGDNPFISDVTELTAMANGLPDRTGRNAGVLEIKNSTTQTSIQSICDAKNWVFK